MERPTKKTLALFLGSAALLAGFYIVLDKLEDTLEAQLANRMALAVDQLGKDDLALRLGGIYTLEGLARTSESEYGPIMEILTAFVRRDPDDIEAFMRQPGLLQHFGSEPAL